MTTTAFLEITMQGCAYKLEIKAIMQGVAGNLALIAMPNYIYHENNQYNKREV